VDFGLKVIKIRGKGGKERLMPLIQELEDKIKKYLIIKKEYFNSTYKATNLLVNNKANKVDENFVYRVINNYFSDATTKEKKSPHMLRHSFATHLLENGADINSIKELMGHASLASTQVYAQINLKELKKVYQKAHPRMKK
jgi:integrase/recombinase XerC